MPDRPAPAKPPPPGAGRPPRPGRLPTLRRPLTRRYTRCGKPGCRCQADPPRPHGPYYQLTRKVVGKTVATRLTAGQAARYTEWIANQRELRRLLHQGLEDISRQAAELILGKPPQNRINSPGIVTHNTRKVFRQQPVTPGQRLLSSPRQVRGRLRS